MAKKLTPKKAREILHDKSVHGHPLTDKQRRFFGAISGGAPMQAQDGKDIIPDKGLIPLPEYKPSFLNPYGYSFSPEPNVNIYGLGVEAQHNINDRLNLHGGLSTESVKYPGGSQMFMKPQYNVGLTYKFENGGWLDKYGEGGTMQEYQENYNDNTTSYPPGFVGMGNNTKGRNYSPAWGGQFAMGGSLPGAVGFTYARTHSPAPSEGPYAKKTMPSAKDGEEITDCPEGFSKNVFGICVNASGQTPEQAYGASKIIKSVSNNNSSNIPIAISDNTKLPKPNLPIQPVRQLDKLREFSGPLKPEKDTRSWWSDSRAKERGDELWNATKKVTAVGQFSPEPVSRYSSIALNSLMGAADTYFSLEDNDLTNARINAIGAIPLPGYGSIKALRNTPGLSSKQKMSVVKSALGALGIDLFGTASDLTNNFGLEKKKNGGMTYYQHGLDWKPKTISRDGSLIPIADEGFESLSTTPKDPTLSVLMPSPPTRSSKKAEAVNMLTIKDPRKIRMTTGLPINPNRDLTSGTYNMNEMDNLMKRMVNKGISEEDAWNIASIAFQETGFGKTDPNLGHILGKWGKGDYYDAFINAYQTKMKDADRLKITDPYTRLQVYNGLGTVTPKTEKDYHKFEMKKIYGVPIPKGGINMKENPLYGKQIIDIRDNVLRKNPEFVKYMSSYYKKKNGGWLEKYDTPQAQTGDALKQLTDFANRNNLVSGVTVPTQSKDEDKKQAVLNAVKQGKVKDLVAGTKATTKNLIEKSNKNVEKDEATFKRLAEQSKKENDEELAERQAARDFNERKSKTFTFPTGETKTYEQMTPREKWYIAGKSLEGKGSIGNENNFFNEYLNPFTLITNMAGNLGEAPYEAKQSNSNLPYLTAIGAPLLAGAMGFDPLGSAIKTVEHPLVSVLPSVIKNKAFTPYGEALFFGAADKVGSLAAKIPGLSNLYKGAAEKVAGQSAGAFRNISDIKDIFKAPKYGGYTGIIGVGDESAVRQSGRNLIKNYIYGDATGFTPSSIPTQGLEEYTQKYGPLKKYQLDLSGNGDVPVQFKNFLNEHGFTLQERGVIDPQMPLYEKFDRLKSYVKSLGEVPMRSGHNLLGADDIGGHMKYLRYNPESDDIMMKTQDIWKFTPKDYVERYSKPGDVRLNVKDPVNLENYLKDYSRNKQASLMERSGKPFILLDERPITLKVDDVRSSLNIPKTVNENTLKLSNEEMEAALKELSDYDVSNLENFAEYKQKSLNRKNLTGKQKKGGVIKDDRGQWAHPGKVTKINSNQITMKGVPYPVLGISDEGDTKMMYPEQEYTFKGKTVTEYPQKKKNGGWLDKYN